MHKEPKCIHQEAMSEGVDSEGCRKQRPMQEYLGVELGMDLRVVWKIRVQARPAVAGTSIVH